MNSNNILYVTFSNCPRAIGSRDIEQRCSVIDYLLFSYIKATFPPFHLRGNYSTLKARSENLFENLSENFLNEYLYLQRTLLRSKTFITFRILYLISELLTVTDKFSL